MNNRYMDFAKDHWKTLVIFGALAVAVGSIAVMDSPAIQGISGSSPAGVSPTPTPNVGSAQPGTVKADTFGITITLAPTHPQGVPPPAGCSKLAVDLVLDTSSSMKNPRSNPRIDALKEAVSSFISEIPDDAEFAAQRFDRQARSVVSPIILKDGKGGIKDTIDNLTPAGEGGTHTKEGLYKAIKIIEEGNTMFPGRQWTLILLSDGAPNPSDQAGDDPASKLKSMGVKIITIGLDMDEEENVSPEEARDHMRRLASSPSDFYDINSDDLSNVYNSLSDKLCK
jgi:uncharacterized protein YegL